MLLDPSGKQVAAATEGPAALFCLVGAMETKAVTAAGGTAGDLSQKLDLTSKLFINAPHKTREDYKAGQLNKTE